MQCPVCTKAVNVAACYWQKAQGLRARTMQIAHELICFVLITETVPQETCHMLGAIRRSDLMSTLLQACSGAHA